MTRYCAACGTEVEETALFCPTCGQPIDQESETEIPPAPAWPESAPPAEPPVAERTAPSRPDWETAPRVDRFDDPPAPEPDATPDAWDEPEPQPAAGTGWEVRHEEPTRAEPAAPAPAASPIERREGGRDRPPRRAEAAGPRRSMDLPITTPVMLSGWLIGIGTLLAALGILIGLFGNVISPIDVLLLLLLLGISATVFLSSKVPEIPHLKLITLAAVLVGFGMALDRIGSGGAGAGELLFFFGTAAAAIGAIIVELGRDQPLGGPQT
ncbi:MAG: zinc-ribbon domain-containing protein [Chloroflexi bacterium]|nr:zinc-ribbon domain-containing protein [Chloroflexota bacterium]